MPSYSAEDMIKLRSADKALIFLRAYLESGILLRESELTILALKRNTMFFRGVVSCWMITV